jgi:hypothetical protein
MKFREILTIWAPILVLAIAVIADFAQLSQWRLVTTIIGFSILFSVALSWLIPLKRQQEKKQQSSGALSAGCGHHRCENGKPTIPLQSRNRSRRPSIVAL